MGVHADFLKLRLLAFDEIVELGVRTSPWTVEVSFLLAKGSSFYRLETTRQK